MASTTSRLGRTCSGRIQASAPTTHGYPGMSATNGSAARRSLPIEQAEALICSLAGVVTARILTGDRDDGLEVYVVADDQVPHRQVARNIQSALLAHLGVRVDSQRISIASAHRPGANGKPEAPIGAAEPAYGAAGDASAPQPDDRPRLRLDGLCIERAHPHRLRCRLAMACGDAVHQGEAEVIDGPGAPLEAAARAALDAWRQISDDAAPAIELDGVRLVEIAGRPYVVAALRARDLRSTHYPSGAAAALDSMEVAAALAVIHAVEPWLCPEHRPVPVGQTP